MADGPDPEGVRERYRRDCAASGIEPHQVPHDALVVAANVLAQARRRRRRSSDAPRPPTKNGGRPTRTGPRTLTSRNTSEPEPESASDEPRI